MIRNDYRRALIMLRGLNNGYSGHVRLERRTLNGSMQFAVNGVQGGEPLSGVLIGESHGNWFSHSLGPLTKNRQDQMALLASFDPRNIQGRDLDDYQIVGVAQLGNPQNPLVMGGFLSGSRDIDWQAVQAALGRMAGSQPRTAGATPAPTVSVGEAITALPEAVPVFAPASAPTGQPVAAAPQPTPGKAVVQPVAQRIPVEQPAAQQPEAQADAAGSAAQGAELIAPRVPSPQPAAEPAPIPGEQTAQPAPMQSVGFSVPLSKDAEPPLQASALMSLPNPEQPWPQNVAALRPLFELNPRFSPFPSRDYVFVRAPMPSETGESYCAIGIKAVDAQMRVLCYAVPGVFALEPPPGLEGYAWRAAETGGYWTTCIDLQTGEPYDGDDP